MSYLATAGLVVGGGLSAYGASQQPSGPQAHEAGYAGFMPQADPLLSALTQQSLLGLGTVDPNVARQALPTQQLLATAAQSGQYSRRQYRYLQAALGLPPDVLAGAEGLTGKALKKYLKSKGASKQASKGMPLAITAAQAAGYGKFSDILRAQEQQAARDAALQQRVAPVAQQVQQGILASQARSGQYLQELPSLLGGPPVAETSPQVDMAFLTGSQNPFIRQLTQDALITAQRYGVNPYNYLEQARSTALQRALALVNAEQAARAGQTAESLNVAQLRQQGGATAAQLGGAQAQMLANIQAQQLAAQQNQAQAWGELGSNLAAYGLIGADLRERALQRQAEATRQGPAAEPRDFKWIA